MIDILTQQIKNEVTKLGVTELTTPEQVDAFMKDHKGTALVFVNSVCGCAGGVARPALGLAMSHTNRPDAFATVFASSDREATLRARSYFTGMPPSSPSFALLRDGKLVAMVHRSDIEIRDAREVAAILTGLFDQHCAKVGAN